MIKRIVKIIVIAIVIGVIVSNYVSKYMTPTLRCEVFVVKNELWLYNREKFAISEAYVIVNDYFKEIPQRTYGMQVDVPRESKRGEDYKAYDSKYAPDSVAVIDLGNLSDSNGNRFDNTKNKVMSVMVYSNEGRKYVSPVKDVGLH